jgi:hypothetical protein
MGYSTPPLVVLTARSTNPTAGMALMYLFIDLSTVAEDLCSLTAIALLRHHKHDAAET